jgi:hypothetical protein
MTLRGIRLFPIGLIVLSAAIANAQTKLVPAADETAAAPAAAPAPVLPKRPAEMAPKPPKVTCRGDQITISADNSTLDSILFAVKGCTGAKIEIPEGASRVRSFEELGPGPVREVLDQLLSGTQYNYVIQSSEANPAKVETVLMSMRSSDGDKAGAISTDLPMTAGRRAWQHMQKFDKPDPSTVNEDGTPVEADAATPASESTAAQPVDQGASADAAPSEAAASTSPAPPLTPVAAPIMQPGADPSKVVQDRIAAMQQMFNQRQQMIQKQNQSQSATPQ